MMRTLISTIVLAFLFSSCVTQKGFEKYADKHPERSLEVARKTFDIKSMEGALYCAARYPTIAGSTDYFDSAKYKATVDSMAQYFDELLQAFKDTSSTEPITIIKRIPFTPRVDAAIGKLKQEVNLLAIEAARYRTQIARDSAMNFYHESRAEVAQRMANDMKKRVDNLEDKNKSLKKNFVIALLCAIALAAALIALILNKTGISGMATSLIAAMTKKKK